MDLIGIFRAIFGLIFILFVPGFVLSWVFYPTKESIAVIERIAYSFVLSIASTILAVLFLDIGLGVNTSPRNIVLMILCLICLSIILWKIELIILKYLENRQNYQNHYAESKISQYLSLTRLKITGVYHQILEKLKKKRTDDI